MNTKCKYLICWYLTCLVVSVATLFASQKSHAQPKIDSLLNLITPELNDSLKAQYYYEIADIYNENDSSIHYSLLSLSYCSAYDEKLLANNYHNLAVNYHMQDATIEALDYSHRALKIFEKIEEPLSVVRCYNVISSCFEDFNNFDSALYYANKALEICVEKCDTGLLTYTYCNIGRINTNIGFYESAEDYYQMAYFLDSVSGNLLDLANDCYYIAALYEAFGLGYYDKAKEYMQKSVLILDSLLSDDPYYITCRYNAYSELAHIYIKLAQQTGNESYADSCLFCLVEVGNYYFQQREYSNYISNSFVFVDYYLFYDKYEDALKVLLECGKYLSKLVSNVDKLTYYEYLSNIYEHLGNYKLAYENQLKRFECGQHVLNDSTLSAVANSKVEQAMMIEKMEQKRIAELHEAEKHRMRIVIISLICGLSLVGLLVIVMTQLFRLKRKSNIELAHKNEMLAEQKEEITAQNEKLSEQYTQLEQQNEQIEHQRDVIQASINYAHRIQESLLTPASTIDEIFPNHFLLYKPRNIVSGDFYWVRQFGDNKVCVVADCTGHGVPGGFMSMLGITNLNYIVGQELKPDIILNKLRDAVIISLRQRIIIDNIEDNIAQSRDGMDVAIYVINERQMTLSYAGANNSLVLIRNNEEIVLKPNKMPVGIYAKMPPFERIDMDLQKGDCIYTFTDGYQDQFGIASGRKFMSKRMRELLLEIHNRAMEEQKEILELAFNEWCGPAENQTDDVLIMGVKI